jgi:hypothetical protein
MPPWSYICDVDISGVEIPASGWNTPAYPDKPQRIFEPVCRAVLATVLAHFPGCTARDTMLSRMRPGQVHGFHVDQQTTDTWVTRVHVPLVTNPGAWMRFDGHGFVHFEVGSAYTFDTNIRHQFGNDGTTDRVHLIFDVVRK